MKIEKMVAVRKNIRNNFSSLFKSPEPGIHQISVPLTNEVSCCTDALNLPKFLALEPDEDSKIKQSVMKLINFEMADDHHLWAFFRHRCQGQISPYKFLVPCLSVRVKFINQ